MTAGRVIEMITEAVPGTVVQLMAMMSPKGDISLTPLLALTSR